MSEPRRGGNALTIAVVAFALPLLYALSLGPAIFLSKHLLPRGGWGPGAIDAIYYPLEWLADKSPAFHRVIWWYAELWQ